MDRTKATAAGSAFPRTRLSQPFSTYILPSIADVEPARFSLEHLEDLRLRFQGKQGLALKNDTKRYRSLRTLFRDARKAGVEAAFPFADLEWPRRVVPGPDLFTKEERARLLGYFFEYALARGSTSRTVRGETARSVLRLSLHALFSGMRPSEPVALRVKSLDLTNGTLFVERSRSLGAEAAPKTAASARVVRLTPRNVEVLRPLIELRAEPEDYVFKNTLGEPIDQRSFYKLFCSAQRVLAIPMRELYTTKGTYVSTRRTRGVNLA